MNKQQLLFLRHGKTVNEIAERLCHAPARNAVMDAAARGVDSAILQRVWYRHIESCRRRGIPVPHIELTAANPEGGSA